MTRSAVEPTESISMLVLSVYLGRPACLAGPAGLGAGSPIGRRKRHPPKARRGLCELHSNRGRSRHFVIHGDHPALLLFPAGFVLQEQLLPGSYHALQSQQRTMSVDHKGLRIFREPRAFIRRSVHHNWNVQINPPAAPAFQPQRWLTEILAVHAESG